MGKIVLLIIIFAAVAGGVYYYTGTGAEPTNNSVQLKVPVPGFEDVDEMIVNEGGETTEMKYSGKVLAGNSSPILDFNKADYETAVKSDKLVVLYFYANWCPICKDEVANALYPAFNDLDSDRVIGFRINYNDNETDGDEVALAREFGVAYQHTKVFLKNGGRILKSPESWNKARYLSEINKAI